VSVMYECIYPDDLFSVVGCIRGCYARGRRFDPRTVRTFVCMNMSVCIGSGRFLVFTKKKVYM
jgi:hypothetical protein